MTYHDSILAAQVAAVNTVNSELARIAPWMQERLRPLEGTSILRLDYRTPRESAKAALTLPEDVLSRNEAPGGHYHACLRFDRYSIVLWVRCDESYREGGPGSKERSVRAENELVLAQLNDGVLVRAGDSLLPDFKAGNAPLDEIAYGTGFRSVWTTEEVEGLLYKKARAERELECLKAKLAEFN